MLPIELCVVVVSWVLPQKAGEGGESQKKVLKLLIENLHTSS